MAGAETSTHGPFARRAAAVLLALEALLLVSPVVALAQLWLGATVLGGGIRLRIPDVAAQGLVHLAAPVLVVAFLACCWGTARGSRRWVWCGLVLQPVAAAYVVVPLLQPFPTLSRVPAGRIVLAALVAATTVVLVLTLLRRESRSTARKARVSGAVAAVAAVTLLAVSAVGVVVGLTATTLPAYPLVGLLPDGEGSGTGTAAPLGAVPQNPGLSRNPWNSLHNDSWATDAYAVRGPRSPRTGAVETLFTGGDCATVTFDSRGRLVTVCSTLRRVEAWVLDAGTLDVLARAQVGERSGALTDFAGGGYFFLDARDRIVLATADGIIRAIAVRDDEGSVSLVPDGEIDVRNALAPDEKVTSVLPDWSGRYWFVGARGTVGLADPDSGGVRSLSLGGESIENSFAVTRDAAYVVTGSALYRLAANGDGTPAVVWREPYDAGSRRKPGQTSRASGTTPTVFADGTLVAITDNAEPRMNVVVMSTAEPARQRVVCRVPVFDDGHSATENSLVAVGRSLLVENNDGYDPPVTATVGGATTTPGLARVDVADDGCRVAWWNRDLAVPSLVSKASGPDGVLYTYTKPPSWWGGDGWYFTAVDLATGRVVWTRLAGSGLAFNNHYAGIAVSPRGDLVAGTVSGLAVLRSG